MSLTRIAAKAFKSPPPDVPWIVRGLVAQGALTLMAGVGGLGKSSLALGLCAAVARGDKYYAGFALDRKLPMVYVDAENGVGEMHRRAHGFGIFQHFYEFEGNLAEHLLDLGKEMRPEAFVVLDSFRALYPYCEEDQSKDVLPVLRALQSLARETSCGILVLHHTTKGGGTFRGSGEFQNRPEITVTMKRDGHGNRFLDWEKCRMGVEPERKYLRLLDTNGALSWVEGRDIPAGRPGGDLDL